MKFHLKSTIAQYRVAGFLECPCRWQILPRHGVPTVMIVLFGFLHVADGVVTYLGLSYASVNEVNPLLNYLAGLLGLGIAISLLKLTILAVITFIFLGRHSIRSRWGITALAWVDTFYSWVVANNFILVMGT